ncbi:MAG: amino acid adenylation domain-containing protein, partial [Clostridia bacterium]|nr:amino acid adenylation domain-containing protein [Clostridia bacterium]
FANEVKDNSINAIDNQNYPQQELVKKIIYRKSLFDVMFAYQSEDMTEITLGDKKADVIPTPINSSKCDLSFYVYPRENETVLMAEYCTDLFKQETINKLLNAYNTILTQALNEDILIKDIDVVSVDENDKISSFNNTEVKYEENKCIHTIFNEIAKANADTKAIIATDKTLTYSELDTESNRIANALIEKGVKSGDVVAFVLNRKSYVLSTMLGILKTGAAYLPIDPDYPQDRIQYVLNDSNARFCITEENISELLSNTNNTNPNVETTSDSICYCIYTSGSTGKPKGALITHKNVVNYVNKNEHNVLGGIITEEKNILSVTTTGFDIFVTESLLPLANGLTVILADEEESRIQSKLAKLITSTNAEVIQTTPTKMKAFISDKDNLDYLKQLKVIILGGEALDKALTDELKTITDAKIFNIYGPTETTVWSTFTEVEEDVTIGKPIANTQVYITDNYNNIVPVGVTGELCIAGDGVCAGYLNREALTNEKFIDNPFGEGKLYKTGDLAYWREDGNICYVGRNDFQVKIRGQRIELGEIENAISSVDGVVQCAVIVREDNDNRQYICAFYTGTEINPKDFRNILSSKLPKYMVPHIFTHLEKMPMTASGKANRNALPEIDLTNIGAETEYVAPTTEKEAILTKAIENVLRIEKVSILDNFFDLGGDSLKSIELVSEIEDKGYTVNVKTIFEAKDIQVLANELKEKQEKEEKIEYSSVLPATSAQMRVYTSQFMSPDSTHYNISYMFNIEELDVEKLEVAINKLINRHEALRTTFQNINGEIMQIINDSASVEIQKLNSSNTTDFVKPFDLSKAPLLRVGVYENTVMIDTHHIVVDGTSSAIFFKELNELYMGRELPATVQYGEFAVTDSYTEENEKYWLDVFSEEINTLDLPTDYTKPETQSFNGANVYTRIDDKLNENILEKCKQLGITPYAFYLSCYNILLSKFSSNEDICIGVPSSGRTSKFLDTIGMFVNTLALRNKATGTKTFIQFANEVKDNSINAIDNQNYPQQELVKKINYRKSLFDVMFAYQSEDMTEITLGDKKAEVIPTPINSSKCDLSFYVYPRENETVLMAEYCTDLFKQETINKLLNAY